MICLGGGISKEDWFIEKVKNTFKTMNVPFNQLTTTKITRCKFDNDSNLLGCVLFATNQKQIGVIKLSKILHVSEKYR